MMRVAVISVAGILVQTAIFEVLGIWLKLVQPSTAVLVGAEIGILTNFFLNNRFAFSDRIQNSLLVRLLRYHLVVSGSLIIQYVFVFIAEHLTTNLFIIHGAYFIGVLIGFLFNYTGYRLWVWEHHEERA